MWFCGWEIIYNVSRIVLQVWDVATGTRQYTFEGHEAPVYSVCPHHKENIQVFFFNYIDCKARKMRCSCSVNLFFPFNYERKALGSNLNKEGALYIFLFHLNHTANLYIGYLTPHPLSPPGEKRRKMKERESVLVLT